MIALSFVSCKKYLAFDYYDGGYTEAQYWNIDANARGQLNGGYTFILDSYNRYDGAMLASGCDEAVNCVQNSNVNIFNNGSWSSLRYIDDEYANFYNGIRQVNVFLAHVAIANITPATDKPRLTGEAYFLRAYFEFELMKRYGGIVPATKIFNITDNLNLPRSTFDQTVAQIVSDCDSAGLTLPIAALDYGSGDRGRATKAAELALKSRTLLYAASPLNNPANDLSRWQRAADAANAVVNLTRITNTTTGATGPACALLPNYIDWYNYNTQAYNAEVIFATQAPARDDIELLNAPVSYSAAVGRTNPTQEMVDAYEMKTTGLPITDPASGYDLANPYKNRDPRLTFSILYNGNTLQGKTLNSVIGTVDGIGGNIYSTRTGYYMHKFLVDGATWNQPINTLIRRPWVIFRYAEMLLNYAEAQNEAVGPDATVYAAINKIRARTSVAMPPLPAGLSQSQMRDRIRNERRVELAFEEHRFWDVRRWKIGEQTFNAPVSGIKITSTNGVLTYDRFTFENRIFTAKNYLYPIPQVELNNASKLTQNPGY